MVSWFIVVTVFLLDRVTKLLAIRFLKGRTVVVIPGFFNLVFAENKGAAFSIFSSSTGVLRFLALIGFPAAIVAALAYLLVTKREKPLYLKISFSLIIGGAIGNLYDRIAYGTVVDFLDFYAGRYHWPAFNVADIAVFVGTAMLILGMSRKEKSRV
ncbi:signal peptidase II [Desulfurobacterium sp.]